MLTPINTGIFFVFVDETTSEKFINTTNAGIVIHNGGPQADVARWGMVISIGKDVTETLPGDYILIEHGMWTTAFMTDGIRLWGTDETKILATSQEEPDAVI